MSFGIVLFLLTLFALAFAFNRRRLGWVSGALLFAWLFFVGTGVFAEIGLGYLQDYKRLEHPVWTENSVILLLGGGGVVRDDQVSTSPSAYSRVFEAARLYALCAKERPICRIITSGGDPRRLGETEAVVMKRELVSIGIPADSVIIESASRNTLENIYNSVPMIKAEGFDQVILVTSSFHMKRALTICEMNGIDVVPAPSDRIAVPLTPLPFSNNFWLGDVVFHEFGGLVQARLL